MVSADEDAPDFTAPMAHDGIEPWTLSENLDRAPLVLAFFPGAFTSTCRTEMRTFEDRLDEFAEAGATVVGVSTDSPFSLAEWRDRHDLSFGLAADTEREAVDAYGVRTEFEGIGYEGVAQRAVFVVDGSGTVTYAWVADDPKREPDYDAVLAAADAA